MTTFNFHIPNSDAKIKENPHGFSLHFDKKTFTEDGETDIFPFKRKRHLKKDTKLHFLEPTTLNRKYISDDLFGNMIRKVMTYKSNVIAPKSTFHFGKLKLFLTTLNFMTKFVIPNLEPGEKAVWIYAGSVHGSNSFALVTLFPEIRDIFSYIVFVDPRQFDSRLKTQDVTLMKQFFTDKLSKELKTKYMDDKIVFVSDIRIDPV